MLTPENIQALGEAIDAVIEQCGDDEKYADLTASLTDASSALGELDEGKSKPASDDGEDTFEGAQKRFTDSRKGGDAE